MGSLTSSSGLQQWTGKHIVPCCVADLAVAQLTYNRHSHNHNVTVAFDSMFAKAMGTYNRFTHNIPGRETAQDRMKKLATTDTNIQHKTHLVHHTRVVLVHLLCLCKWDTPFLQ